MSKDFKLEIKITKINEILKYQIQILKNGLIG